VRVLCTLLSPDWLCSVGYFVVVFFCPRFVPRLFLFDCQYGLPVKAIDWKDWSAICPLMRSRERWTQLIRSLHGSGLGIPWVNQRSRLAVSEQIGLRQLSGRVTWKHGCAQDFSLEGGNTERPMTTESGGRVPGEGVAVPSPPAGDLESAVCELHQRGSGRREREFYSQLHCRHTRRAIIPSKLVPMLSNIYNERYTKENIHRRRRNRQYGKTNKWKKNKLCAHTITRQARTIQAVYNIINDNFVTNYTDKNEWKCLFNHISHHTTYRAPAYCDNAVQPVNRRTLRPDLRSENSLNYCVPWVRTKLGEHAFSYTQDQLFGTIYPQNSVLNQTLRASRRFLWRTFYAALLPRRGPHIASHSVCPSVPLSLPYRASCRAT